MLRKRFVMVGLVLSVGLFGCKKGADLAVIQQQAIELVGNYGPQVASLQGKLSSMTKKLGSLPEGMDGVGALLKKLVGAKDTLAGMQRVLSSAKSTVANAVKDKDASALKGFLGKLKTDVGDKLASVTALVSESESKVVLYEKKAKEMTAPPAPAASFSTTLSTGFKLDGATGGVESQLVGHIRDAARPVDEASWYSFDRLSFETGSATLEMAKSEAQLKNMSEILKAFPGVKLKIGGYIDNTGKESANKKISKQRARAVKEALAKIGAEADRLETEGYGPVNPVCPANDTDECKAKNRRIAVSLTAK